MQVTERSKSVKKMKKILSTYVFLCLLLLGCLWVLLDTQYINKDILVLFTFLINGFAILWNLMNSSKIGYQLRDIIYTYMFIFMFISPLIQYSTNSFPWWDTHLITNSKVVYANILILIFIMVYEFFYNKRISKTKLRIKNNKANLKDLRPIIDSMFIISLLFGGYIIFNTGFSNLFSRATNTLSISNSSVYLIVNNSFRSITVINVALNILYYHKNRKIYKKTKFIVSVILMILVNFPTATPRFWMASVYIGLIATIIRRLKNPHLLKLMIILGLIVVFPFINTFRNLTFGEAINLGIKLPLSSDYFVSGDFDSYSMLVRSINYVEDYGVSWGYQLLGNLFFFIPRSIWVSKPVGSGLTIATSLGWQFGNVSCPLIGEGYLNFGLVGVIIFAIIVAKISKYLDVKYTDKITRDEKSFELIEILFPFTLGFMFFIFRGDLLSSLSYYIGFMIPLGILYILRRIPYIKY